MMIDEDEIAAIIADIRSGGRIPQAPVPVQAQATGSSGGGGAPSGGSAPTGKLSAQVGQTVTITGEANNAHQGAMVLRGHMPVFVLGLDSWPATLRGKVVEVTGLLRKGELTPEATVDANGAVSHGGSGEDYYLENASWKEAP